MSEQPKSPPAHTPPPVLPRVSRPEAPAAVPAPPAAPVAGEAPASPAPPGTRGRPLPEVTAAAAIAADLPGRGSLAREGPLHLYYLVGAAQASGRLTIGSERGTYSLVFKKGVVEHVASTYPQDDLGLFLVKRGVVAEEQLERARRARDDFGGDLVSALTGLQLMDPSVTFEALQDHGAGLAWRALATDAGSWQWEPGVAAPRSSFPLGSRWGVLCDAFRRIDTPGALKRLGPRVGRVATRVGGRIQMADLRLTSQEVRACSLFDGVRSVEEIAADSPAEADLVRRIALLLAETELLAFGAEKRAGAAPRAGAAGGAPPPRGVPATPPPSAGKPASRQARAAPQNPRAASPAPSPAPPEARASPASPAARPAVGSAPARPGAPPAATPEQLAVAHDRMKRAADHFQVLGLKRNAAPGEIKAAYFQLAKLYHPDAAAPGEAAELTKLRADIFARVSEAWGALGDDRRRANYLEELESGGAVDVMAILQAENLFQMAAVLVKSRQYRQAADKLDEAVKLNGNEPEFSVWQAWVQFLLAPPEQKKPQRASSSQVIEAALKRNPRCIPGYLFLGQMAKLVGDSTEAERAWKRGLVQDERNADLLRELRYLKK